MYVTASVIDSLIVSWHLERISIQLADQYIYIWTQILKYFYIHMYAYVCLHDV